MIANKWYCIAQTGTFDSGCTINVSFDSYVIQFSASVKYGSSAINITRCELPLSANLSLRLRESNGLWSVDLLSNNDITPEIVVADSPYWVAVNSIAGAGNIILTIKDISKDFNTETGGSGGGLDENALRDFLDKYGYTQARDFWKYETTGGGAIHTDYHIIVDGGGAFGGTELGGGGEGGGGGISEFYIQLGEGGQKYKLGNSGLPNVVQIPKYPVVPTNVSEFYNDAGYIGGEQVALIFNRISEVEARVEKLEKLWWVDENGNLHTTYNIVVEGGGAFGTGASDSGGGSTGGLGQITIRNQAGQEYKTDANGVVVIPTYLTSTALDGYATQQWVEGQKYLKSIPAEYITEDELTAKGYALSSDLTKVSNRVTTLEGNFNGAIAKEAAKVSHALTFGSKTYDGSIAQTILPSDLDAVTLSGEQIITGAKTFGSLITANGGIKIPHTASLKIGDITLIEEDGALKVLGNLVVTGGGAFGTGSTSGGGGTSGGLGSVIIKTEGGVEYKTNSNGVVIVPNWITASALNGYATQSWVEGKKYLTAHQDISHLLSKTDAANTYQPKGNYLTSVSWSEVSGKPTFATVATSGKYSDLSGVPTSLPASDVYDWAKAASKPTYTASEVGALPLSGGTLTGDLVLGWHSSAGSKSIAFTAESGGNKAYLFADAYDLKYLFNNQYNTLIHSGNYSSYALPLSGGWMSSGSGIMWETNTILWDSAPQGISLISSAGNSDGYWTGLSAKGYYGLQIRAYGGDTDLIQARGATNTAWGTWRALIHSGNIGSYNAGSATKLATARTIWGQSFDGTGNISGNLLNVGLVEPMIDNSYNLGSASRKFLYAYVENAITNNSTNGYFIGSRSGLGATDGGALIYAYGNTPISFYTGGERMRILGNGNVLIGTITDIIGKLQVEGDIYATAWIRTKGAAGWYSQDYGGGIYMTDANYVRVYNGKGFQVDGNVLIGNTTDRGHKLAVIRENSTMTASTLHNSALFIGASNSVDSYGLNLWTEGSGNGFIQQGRTDEEQPKLYNLSLQPFGGNVLIGTTTDSGDKLRINGAVRAAGHIRLDRYHGASEYLQLEAEDVNINYRAYDTDGWCSHNFYSNDNLLVRIDGYAGELDINGNLVVSGGGAFGSDVRYKDILDYTNIDLATIADAPLFTYQWNDREDKKVYLGTSAQYWLNTAFTNAVNTDNPNFYHLDYGALAVGMGISVAREVKGVKNDIKGVKTEVEQLREEVKQLKEKLNKYEQIWHN